MRKMFVIISKCYLLQICIGFLTGLITISLNIFIPAIFIGVSVVVVGKVRYRINLFLLILFLLLGGVRASTYSLSFCQGALAVKEIYGEVVSYPKFTNYSQQVTVRATGIGSYIVYLERYPEFLPGDILLLTDLVVTPYTEKEVGYQKYLRSEGVCGIISRPSKVSLTSQNNLIRGLSEVRSSISAKYAKIYPEPMASIISAMVIGDDSNLGEETKEIFLLTGTSHLLVVSGGNLMILFSIGLRLSSRINRMVLLRMLAILILLYALIVGIEDSSVQRATIMFVVYVVSLLVGRKGGGLLALIYAATLMLLINPYAFFGIGFQYSFVVVLFLILLTEKVNRVISRISFIKSSSSILSVIITAQIAALLVGVLNSLGSNIAVSTLANLVWAPIASAVQPIAMVTQLLPTELAKMLAAGTAALLSLGLEISSLLAKSV